MATVTTEKVKELYDELAIKASAWADAVNEGKSEMDTKPMKEATKTALDSYNKAASTMAYETWAAGENAVETAIRTAYIPGLKRVSMKKNKTTGMAMAEISDARGKISLVAMQLCVGRGVFHDPNWFDSAQKLAFIIANAVDKSLGGTDSFNYAIEEAAKSFAFSGDADPKSIKSVVSALQQVVDKILYIPAQDKKGEEVNSLKVTSHEWNYIRDCMTRQGGEIGEVVIGNTEKMAELVADTINLMLTNGKYTTSTK